MVSDAKKYLSVTEVANMLGVTRQAIHKMIKKGKLKAIMIGRTYGIPRDAIAKIVGDITGHVLSEEEKDKIDKIIDKTIKEYGEVLKMLGND